MDFDPKIYGLAQCAPDRSARAASDSSSG
jgi:hypothetical protein